VLERVSGIYFLDNLSQSLLTGALGLITTLGAMGCPVLVGVLGPGLARPLDGALLFWY